jgi:hypothetical protein
MYENLKSQILHLLQKDATPRTRALLSQALGLSAEWRDDLNVALDELGAAGQLVLGPGNQVRLPSLPNEVIGTFHAHARGFGFVTPQQAMDEGEVFIPAKAMGNAMTGDRVLAQIVRKQSSRDPDRISGKIVRVLERAHSTIVRTLRWEAGTWVVYPDGANFQRPIQCEGVDTREVEDGDKVSLDIRVYTITDQDRTYTGAEPLSYSSHGWMRSEAGSGLLVIWDESAWKAHNATGKSNWNQYETHIQGHGHLGSQYPKYKYGVEGDTPSFLYLMPTGLNNPEDPTQCSWGGTFKGNASNLWQPASSCRSYFDRFYPAAFSNFAARMDWAKDGTGNRNPVIVLDSDNGISVLTKTFKQGTTVVLDASKTFDPDGDKLKFSWWIQSDTGTYSGNVNISNASSSIATVNVPSDSAGKSFHVICEVIDDGTHKLSDYRRIIFKAVQ